MGDKLNAAQQCLNCRGGWGLNLPTVFSIPLTHCQIMFWGVSYILYTYDLHHNFGRASTVEKIKLPTQRIYICLQTQHNYHELCFSSCLLLQLNTIIQTVRKFFSGCVRKFTFQELKIYQRYFTRVFRVQVYVFKQNINIFLSGRAWFNLTLEELGIIK